MPDAVVVLGAGASAEFGVPVLSRIFKDAQARRYLREKTALRASLQEVFWGPRGHTLETSEQSLTIEEMLTVLKDWDRENAPGPADRHDITQFRKHLYVLIEHAVFEGKSSRQRHLNPLIDFCRSNFDHTTWASFNWDCIFESSFYYSSGHPWPIGRRFNPYIAVDLDGWRQGPRDHLFLKLHGSVNWWVIDGKLEYLAFAQGGPLRPKWRWYDNEEDPDDYPVILEPSFYKYEPESEEAEFLLDQLRPQWNVFLTRLLDADYIIVVGYSLPPADSLARSKILTARQVNQEAHWLIVDRAPRICDRYKRLVGGERFASLNVRLTTFVSDINRYIAECFSELEFEPVDLD